MGGEENRSAGDDNANYDEFLAVLNAPAPGSPEQNGDAANGADDNDGDGAIVYTDEELDAMRQVRNKLMEEHGIPPSQVGAAFLAVATINCKLRVDETVKKIKKLLELMAKLGCPEGIDDVLWKEEAAHELGPYYPPVGKDKRGCQVTWIRGGNKIAKELERAHCQACIMQYLAAHADPKTLREGVSFVVDLTSRKDAAGAHLPKQGNEKLIQAFYQAIPMRPQAILIAGCSLPTRTIVNASIKVASVFIKQKILQRIHFVKVEDSKRLLPEESVPAYLGGKGGGVESYEKWAEGRIAGLTVPEL